ncbi:MAG: uracil-DNA glycosylase [Dehalococcoidia bacterium]
MTTLKSIEIASEGSGRMLREIDGLFSSAAACRLCPGMGCAPVLSETNGPADAMVLFVGEAPGRFGARRTGTPFSGDVAGHRFELLLAAAGLERDEVFVTNAVLCLPLDAHGRNRTPKSSEVARCTRWLQETIERQDPAVVVAMGRVALEAARRISPHQMELACAGSNPVEWNERLLAVVYHPGARSQVHRPWARQLSDWEQLGRWMMEAGLTRGRLHS